MLYFLLYLLYLGEIETHDFQKQEKSMKYYNFSKYYFKTYNLNQNKVMKNM